jgi:hypothetical protein
LIDEEEPGLFAKLRRTGDLDHDLRAQNVTLVVRAVLRGEYWYWK